jgi:hypothetical protein
MRLVSTAVPLALVAALLAGCSDDEPADLGAPPTPSASPTEQAPAPVPTRTRVREVAGSRLTSAARRALATRITATVEDWFDAAYLAGTYPRTDFTGAFPGFTPGAAARARQDQRLMTNAAVGTTTYAVRATAKSVVIDVLAARGRAAAVTATFRLGMVRTGETGGVRRERITGRLYLTREKPAGWRVFGYDVERGTV